MSNVRASKAGFAREAQAKLEEKFDSDRASACLSWINRVAGLDLNTSGNRDNFAKQLRDGVVLCKLANALIPGSVKGPIKPGTMTFTAGENYAKFFNAVNKRPLNLRDTELFQTVDLWETCNLAAVQTCLQAVGREAYKISETLGFGPRESHGEKREFSEEQLKAGAGVIGLQMGTNKGASQAGQNFGKSRGINDI